MEAKEDNFLSGMDDKEQKGCTGEVVTPWNTHLQSGIDLLRNPKYNRGLGFSDGERDNLRLKGLLPPRVQSLDEQSKNVLWSLSRKHDPLDKYQYFMTLLERNERLFYHVLIDNVVDLMPIVYTPTVGLACQKFGHIFQEPRSLWISLRDAGNVRSILNNWPEETVKAVVFTDGERILGLGDLGAQGMGIPIGKLALYTACAGLNPKYLLPVHIDVGTDREELREAEAYIGLRQKRDRTEAYDNLIEEFMVAAANKYGKQVLLQFEDFGNRNALRLLNKFKDRFCTFNDDIQGTASVGVAGILAAQKIAGGKLSDQVYLMMGAGSAGLGIAGLIADAIVDADGLTLEEARKKIWLVDSRGLVVANRSSGGISPTKSPYAHEYKEEITDLEEIVKSLSATCIIGVCAQGGVFTEGVCRAMAQNTERPLIFPMSNPTHKAECVAEDAFKWTNNKCIFASGSPFPPVNVGNRKVVPSQGNNSYIFPGLALGVVASGATQIPDDFFLIAAKSLARQVPEYMLAQGSIYPELKDIRIVSKQLGADIATEVFKRKLNTVPEPKDIMELIESETYPPKEIPDYGINDLNTVVTKQHEMESTIGKLQTQVSNMSLQLHDTLDGPRRFDTASFREEKPEQTSCNCTTM